MKISIAGRLSAVVALCAVTGVFAETELSPALCTLQVSMRDNAIVVDDPRGAVDENTEVWLVWDNTDRGVAIDNWPADNRAKCKETSVSSRGQYTFDRAALPENCAFRAVALGSARVLREGGCVYLGKGQYVETDVCADEIHGVDITFQYSAGDFEKPRRNGWASLIGDDPTFDFVVGRRANKMAKDGAEFREGQFYLRQRGKTLAQDNLVLDIGDNLDVPHRLTIAERRVALDGKTVLDGLADDALGAKHLPILLGCSWAEKSENRGQLSKRFCHAKWYAAKFIGEGGKTLAELVPATLGGTGVFYDKTSGRLVSAANASVGRLAFCGTPGEVIGGRKFVTAVTDAARNTSDTGVSGKGNATAVTVGNARFTLLTERMVRCEWSADGIFEDRPSLTFVNRSMPEVKYTLERKGDGAKIVTKGMTIEWSGGAFDGENLVVNGVAALSEDKENLLGTQRTLDGKRNIKHVLATMEKGILSRRGVTMIDDTHTPLFVPSAGAWKQWVAERPKREKNSYRDITVFAYGHDYKECLGDYVRVAGRIPMPPRWAFGYWWSRFWPDSDSEIRELVAQMKAVNIPMDVVVIDLYWHEMWRIGDRPDLHDEFDQVWGWTGYTWNRRYFPKPTATLDFLHKSGYKSPLNIHPAGGIQPVEKCFGKFAKDYGWISTNGVPFRCDDERWATCYFDDVISPLEKDGADFFWLDWQQWLAAKDMSTLGNTFWLNHLFFTHSVQRDGGTRRPLTYHRWGGFGSHRYQIGFSGDATVSWPMLEAIPWFTATASNVGYGYWGHDLGGHQFPPTDKDAYDGELYTRWMQCGVFTPIFRTHTTKDTRLDRRLWKYPGYLFTLRDAFRLRYRLAPYIYTAAREAYDTGVSICRPMYYDWPEENSAYCVTNAVMFGNDIMAATVSTPADTTTLEAEIDIWFPKGQWYDVSHGALIDGGRTMRLGYTVEENPWFIRAGAIVPIYPDTVNNLANPGTDDLVLICAPGAQSGEYLLYEDDGDNPDYPVNFRRTQMRRSGDRVTIAPRKGIYTLKFPLAAPPSGAKVNGKDCEWSYDAEDLAIVVQTPPQDGSAETVVELVYPAGAEHTVRLLSGFKGEHSRVETLTQQFKAGITAPIPNRRRPPLYSADIPETWQVYWKTRDLIAANPQNMERLLAERDAALKAFPDDLKRFENAIPQSVLARLKSWMRKHGVEVP